MPLYKYQAKNTNGNILKGKIYADNEIQIASLLSNMDFYPIKILPSKGHHGITNLFRRIKINDLAVICKQLYVIIASGINILNAIEIVKKQFTDNTLKSIFDNIIYDINKGKTLTEALKNQKIFPQLFVNLVGVGELSGKMDVIMKRLSDYYEREYKLKQKIIQSLVYPTFVSIFAIFSTAFLIKKVLPVFMSIYNQFDKINIPLPTRIVLSIPKYINSHFIIITNISLIFIIYFIFTNKIRFIDYIKLKSSIYQKTIIMNFTNMMYILLESGISIVEALNICMNSTKNIIVKEQIELVIQNVKEGYEFSEALGNGGIFSDLLIDMVKVGETTGNLDMLLQSVVNYYDIELEGRIVNITSLIEPFIIIFLSLVIGFIVLAVVMPLLEMYGFMI